MTVTPLPRSVPVIAPQRGGRAPRDRLSPGTSRRSGHQSCLRHREGLFWPYAARDEPNIHAGSYTDRGAKDRGYRLEGRPSESPRDRRAEPRRTASLPPGIDPRFFSEGLPLKTHEITNITYVVHASSLTRSPSIGVISTVKVRTQAVCVNPLPIFFPRFFQAGANEFLRTGARDRAPGD